MDIARYEEKRRRLMEILRSIRGGHVCLGESTSNLFRDCMGISAKKLDVRDFSVLPIDAANGYVVVEGMTPYSKKIRSRRYAQDLYCKCVLME